jgi:hypothetical protein
LGALFVAQSTRQSVVEIIEMDAEGVVEFRVTRFGDGDVDGASVRWA